jgi:hypothetical protein
VTLAFDGKELTDAGYARQQPPEIRDDGDGLFYVRAEFGPFEAQATFNETRLFVGDELLERYRFESSLTSAGATALREPPRPSSSASKASRCARSVSIA